MAKRTTLAPVNVSGLTYDTIAKANPAVVDPSINVAKFASVNSEASAIAALDDIGIGVTDTRVYHMIAQLCWAYGKNTSANEAPSSLPIINAFAAKFRGGETGRKALTAKTVESWESGFNAFIKLGFLKAYDTLPVLTYALKLDGAFNSRAARVRDIMEKHKTAAPSEADMDAIVDAAKTDPKLTTFSRGLVTRAEDPLENATYGDMIAKDETIAEAYDAMVQTIKDFHAMVEQRTRASRKKKSGQTSGPSALQQMLAAKKAA